MEGGRQYGLYRRDGRRWRQVEGTGSYPKPTAVRVFQDRLLSEPGLMLRPIPGQPKQRELDSVASMLGLTKVRGAEGGIYYE